MVDAYMFAKRKVRWVIFGALLSLTILSSTNQVYGQYTPDTTTQFTEKKLITKNKFWRSSGELFLAQLIPWSYNNFIRDADFTHISFKSIGNNLKPKSWEWDDNSFKTNQFAHPYQGSMYFSAFRSNGYSFWQSAPASVAGSFMWETMGETHRPAINDFINTSMGGIVLGEMSYLISTRVIDESLTGFKRQANEMLAFLINPMNGLNRIIDGKWGKFSSARTSKLDTVTGYVDVGLRRIREKDENKITRGYSSWYARVRLNYGDPYIESKTPFGNFAIEVEAGDDDSSKLNKITVNGLITSWQLQANAKSDHLLSLTANYNYYENAAFEYGGQSVNMNIYSRYRLSKKLEIQTKVGLGSIILGAVPDQYLYYGEGRNYDYGTGVSFSAYTGISWDNFFFANLNYLGGWIRTLNGNDSNYLLHAISIDTRSRIYKNFSLGIDGGYFSLNGNYDNFPDVRKGYPFIRIGAGYMIR